MRTEQRTDDCKPKTELRWMLIWSLIICVLFGVMCHRQYERSVSEAEQSQEAKQVKEMLTEEVSFPAWTDSWIVKKAMERVIKEYNKEQGYQNTSNQYELYDMEDGYYWITSENIQAREFNYMASGYFMYLGDMCVGLRRDENTFVFEYMNEKQRLAYEEVKLFSEKAKELLDIQEERTTCGEVTFVVVTVKPKNNFVVEGGILPPSVLYIRKKSCNILKNLLKYQ